LNYPQEQWRFSPDGEVSPEDNNPSWRFRDSGRSPSGWVIGAVLIETRRFVVSGLAGLVGAAAITGSMLLWISWRTSLLFIEILGPLWIGSYAGYRTFVFLSSLSDKGAGAPDARP